MTVSFSILYVWCFLLCCVWIWTAIYAYAMRKRSYAIVSVLLCLLSCTELQEIEYILSPKQGVLAEGIFKRAAVLPAALWAAVLVFLSVCALILFLHLRKWRNSHITPMSIKDCGDGHPAGIVFWKGNGRVLFANKTADSISIALTGGPVLNGNEFINALERSPVTLPDGTVWSYRHQISVMDGELLHEFTAANITELHNKTKELEKNTERLQKMNAGLREYSQQIEELVRRREILLTKQRIHDEMNHLLMATSRAFEEENEEKQQGILDSWENSTGLLFQETENEHAANIAEDLCTYGNLLGIEFVCDSLPRLTDIEKMRFLVSSAREAMNNAVKHGEARHLYASFQQYDSIILCTFSNDGKAPEASHIIPAGGLLHLREEAQRLGGTLRTETSPRFQLIISIPEGDITL